MHRNKIVSWLLAVIVFCGCLLSGALASAGELNTVWRYREGDSPRDAQGNYVWLQSLQSSDEGWSIYNYPHQPPLTADAHEISLGLADLCMLGAIQDIGLGCTGKIAVDEYLFHRVLNEFHGRGVLLGNLFHHLSGQLFETVCGEGFVNGLQIRLANGIGDFLCVKGDKIARTLSDVLHVTFFYADNIINIKKDKTRAKMTHCGEKKFG